MTPSAPSPAPPSTASHTRLAALVVSYNTGGFARRCVESLLRDWHASGRRAEDLEVVVVDNASPVDQEPWLQAIEELGARVIRNPVNAGYAQGINLAYEGTRGGANDVVAVLNADVVFLPGSVGTLIDYLLEHPDVGVVDPRMTMDRSGQLQMPRNMLPTLGNRLRLGLARLSRRMARAYNRRRVRLTLPWWTSEGPEQSDMLCGACLFLRRGVVAQLPALLDERYPLWYEDTDLFMTLERKGYRLIHHGGARILHHWSRSAEPGGAFGGELLQKFRVSQKHYFLKFHGWPSWWLVAAIEWLERALPHLGSPRPIHPIEDLGAFRDPIEIRLPRRGRFLIELADEPTWLLTVGIVGEGDRWRCPEESWQWLFDITYYARALDLETLEVLGAWRFSKETPGREAPLEGHEMDAIFGPLPAREGVS